jgi:hypothetical protein
MVSRHSYNKISRLLPDFHCYITRKNHAGSESLLVSIKEMPALRFAKAFITS